ncbi:Stk1 family PASTA domain-containing Ser/Thr kinase [Corynebacterium resistens]|uniref:Stk1 family PASTA domain-containing Ser/Thr kinase n=1 Tax=Corynebacterium resistens TaxID=258224 RepID=UPI002352D25B|nr:Stk1 family PASTA domain-containing Ser/Thr kinase [Corynebacterium resistens]
MTDLYPGDLLEGRYRIAAQIARGGMSTVYTAVDTRLDREVAVKVMDPQLAQEPKFRKRFEREARAVAKLNHPTLVNVFDQGVDEEYVFLVMELVTGGSLRELLAERGPMPPHAAISVMRSVLTALAVAHDSGMIHRDIKPDNVLISDRSVRNNVKLADFGLVRAINTTQQDTFPGVRTNERSMAPNGQVIGTAGYLSPEQVRGEDLDERSDIYSAGILLYELLTGELPFRGTSPEDTAMLRLDKDVPSPSRIIEGVPAPLDMLVARACHRDPSRRFPNGSAFLEAVEKTVERLALPDFVVPVPQHSAVMRALEGSDFGERLSWDHEEMSTRAVALPPQEGTGTREWDSHSPSSAMGYQDPGETRVGPFNPAGPRAMGSTAGGSTPAGLGTAGNGAAALGAAGSGIPALGANESGYSGSSGYSPVHDKPPSDSQGPNMTAGLGTPYEGYGQPGAHSVARNDSARAASIPQRQPARPVGKKLTNRSSGATIVWSVLLLVLVAAVAVGAWWVTSGRYGDIPQVIGMDQASAQATVQEAGFTTEVKEAYSDSVARQSVIGTEPPFNQRAPRGSQVAVLVSLGRPTVPEPGPTDDAASYQTKLKERTLRGTMGEEVYSENVPKGKVAEVKPAAGTEVKTSSTVSFHLSKGPAPIEVPELRGIDIERAKTILKDAGLKVGAIRESDNKEYEAGQVINTHPEKGTTLNRGDSVDIEISSSGRVPLVFGMSGTEAKKRLEDEGFEVEIDGRKNGFVISQSPGPNTRAPKGSKVTVRTI